MKTVETKLPAGEIIEMKQLSDGTWIIKQRVTQDVKVTSKQANSISKSTMPEVLYRCVEAESLSLDDKFMKHKPKTRQEGVLKALIEEAIKKGVKNFYRPIMDPSFTDDGKNICFESGKEPAVGKSYNWWKKVAKEYCPERNSRLGTSLEYRAFLGVLIKNLVIDGASISWAWNAVCNDSKELGHYGNSENAKYKFETTGSRCICGYYDLANTKKILTQSNGDIGFILASGAYNDPSYHYSLATTDGSCFSDCMNFFGVGWLVLEK